MPGSGSVTTTTDTGESTSTSSKHKGKDSKSALQSQQEANGIEQMYKIYEKLNSASDKTTLEPEFRDLLSAVKRSDKEKRLASQFITRFLDMFPLLYNDGIDALLDLCEDDDISIRKQVVKDLITVCKKISTFVPKIANVYGQLLQIADTGELHGIQTCLVSLFHIDAQAALVGLFSQICLGEDIVKERALKFLATKLKDFGPEIVNMEFEKTLLSEAKKSAAALVGDDYEMLIDILLETRILKTTSGQQGVIDISLGLLKVDKDFDASDIENVERLLTISKAAYPLVLQPNISSNPFVVYFCTKVLPVFNDFILLEDGPRLQNETLRTLADFTYHAKQLNSELAQKCLEIVYKLSMEYLPIPPEGDTEVVQYNYGFVECLLFVIHKLGEFVPEFLNSDEDRLNDFRYRLQYFVRMVQAYMKRLREDLAAKKGEQIQSEECKFKIPALKLCANVSTIVKDLFHKPPKYTSSAGLSWKPLQRGGMGGSAEKRKLNTIVAPPAKIPRTEREIVRYQPPSGKFSSRAGVYVSQPSSRGVRGGRGNFRFRGGGRGARRPFRGRF